MIPTLVIVAKAGKLAAWRRDTRVPRAFVAGEENDFFLVEACVDFHTRVYCVPRAAVNLGSFVAGFAIDKKE
jgi:hypothetical protein